MDKLFQDNICRFKFTFKTDESLFWFDFSSSLEILFLSFSVLSAVLLQNVICIQQEEIQKILRVHNSFRRNYAKRGLQNEIANMKLLVSN